MATTARKHSRSHNLLLLQKLLNLRDGASPLTLLLDDLEQSVRPVVDEFITRSKISRSKIIFLSFTTLRKPRHADFFVKAAGRDLKITRADLMQHFPAYDPSSSKEKPSQRAVLVIDSLNYLASTAPSTLAVFLSSILVPNVSILGVYHTDIPLVLPKTFNEYEPHPFTVLCHLATAILRLSSLQQEIDREKARRRALAEPEWGLRENREGVIFGLNDTPRQEDKGGVVLEMELRRRSGRTVSGKFILVRHFGDVTGPGRLMLLSDHSLFANTDLAGRIEEENEPESTFNLDLTEKQRKDRENIVLPYFDAQTDIGAGDGGRILYEMGREDDFDDEEDEI